MRQDAKASISRRSFSRELSGDSLEKICGGKTEENEVKQQEGTGILNFSSRPYNWKEVRDGRLAHPPSWRAHILWGACAAARTL